ncbi:MAG TPA: FoF1 ATP synthase subunit gamma, partial [Gemmataceae bacterium]
ELGQAGPSVRQARSPATEAPAPAKKGERVPYEFLPDPRSILEEIVPVSFKVRLFKCFLDAAVSEQIARRVAMKSATENAGDLIKEITRLYNRTRQANITKEISELIAGSEALK